MEINIQEIAQKLIDELVLEQEKHKHRIEGVAMLFERIRDVITAENKANEKAIQDLEADVAQTSTTFTEQDIADINKAAEVLKEKPRGRKRRTSK